MSWREAVTNKLKFHIWEFAATETNTSRCWVHPYTILMDSYSKVRFPCHFKICIAIVFWHWHIWEVRRTHLQIDIAFKIKYHPTSPVYSGFSVRRCQLDIACKVLKWDEQRAMEIQSSSLTTYCLYRLRLSMRMWSSIWPRGLVSDHGALLKQDSYWGFQWLMANISMVKWCRLYGK